MMNLMILHYLIKKKELLIPRVKKKKTKIIQNSKEDEIKKGEINEKFPTSEQLKNEEIEEMNKYKYFLLKYIYELTMIALIIIFIINAVIGVKTNKDIAKKWMEKNLQFFEDNYAHLGGEREYNPNNLSLIKDSYNAFKFFASGRVYVGWMLIDINLKRRQDLISMLSQLFLFSEKDRITYETSFLPNDDLPIVFSICKRKDIKNTKKNYSEINEFTEIVNPSYFSAGYVLLTEDEETTGRIFSNQTFLSQFKKIEKFIDLVMFTDRRNAKDKHGLIVSFETKDKYSESCFYDMTLFVHMLIDILGSINMKASYKKEAFARRKEYDAKKSRERAEKNAEEMKNAKDEKKNAEKSRPMTREQLQKKEEKERKEALKERRKKLYKVVKA